MHQTLFAAALSGLLGATVPGPDAPPSTPSTAAEGSAAHMKQPAPPSAADSIVAAAFSTGIDTPGETEKASPQPALGWTSFIAPALALLGLAGLAVGLTRRRRAAPGSIRIIEAATLGPRRSLVIADVLGDRLVLGVSEAGVAVLSTRPVPADQAAVETSAAYGTQRLVVPQMGFFQRLLGKSPAMPFEEVLGESIEDQELRAKLAAGVRGVIP